MNFKLLVVGKIKEKYLQEGIKEYCKRLAGYSKLEIIEIEDEPGFGRLQPADIEKIKKNEGRRLLKHFGKREYRIALDRSGKNISSLDLSQLIRDKAGAGHNRLVFIIGGSHGLSEEVLKETDFSWSFSQLTFPHQLIRLILLEQLYRACKINKGEPYHK